MIIPDLVVAEMDRGMRRAMAVTADRRVSADAGTDQAVFVALAWNDARLMPRSRAGLAGELPDQIFSTPASTIRLRRMDPDGVSPPAGCVIKGQVQQWCGMREFHRVTWMVASFASAAPNDPADESR